ncbi:MULTISPECIES: NAD(P)/FAD-dependent oxidoreductase [Paenibacillus]|uniref:2-polyprenyl-6-methoxyphenol hydroxylase-like FAD-dependent oxidoreductase n=1 Tax=Paenibacillus pabuli TaxID=1472 RepID=A0A855YDY2_9BACL|nr:MULTISPECIES: FAD-dependent monooxygenase [Paenibacillus]PWW45378.1 2-polyprenyl-6-methoxyphenol hydroxylase-like FAD-dependent oxidoreductase [Paenibacillus pabuli]PXW11715.1 2-polyprenyl-6-methoxyphenol hydroxylase-like FAD-dependent oxidoreductase [Paenibacillus taichungensis]
MPDMKKAVVIGAGIAGLITARMLSDYYDEVCIIERDELPSEPTNRQGVPQSFHPHRVLPRGGLILEHYFPGYNDELVALGAIPSHEEKFVIANRYGTLVNKANAASSFKIASSSRALLEWVLRQRVQNIDHISFLTNTEVTGLLISEDQRSITGVYTKERGQENREEILAADMVIDAAGRSSKLIKWLDKLGLSVPEPEVLKVSLGYSTRYYKIPSAIKKEWGTVITESDPVKGIRAGMLWRIENDIAGLLLFNAGGEEYPSTKADEFQEQIKYLFASDEIVELENQLEPFQGPRGYRISESIRQHFELMENWPSGLLVLGDAFCSFDPIHGQGMTVAAIEAETIGKCLDEQRIHPEPQFERKVLLRMQQAIEPAWWLSSVADLRWKGVEQVGPSRMKGVAFAQKYINLFTKQAMKKASQEHNNHLFFTQFLMNALILPPSEYFKGDILNMILNDNGSKEEMELRAELGVQDPELFQQRIDEIIPSFQLEFDGQIKKLLESFQHAMSK